MLPRKSLLWSLVVGTLAMSVRPATADIRRLIGTVVDASGRPMEGVAVTLIDIGGDAPEMRADRSTVNAEQGVIAEYNNLPWTEGSKDGDHPANELEGKVVKEGTTDTDGQFYWVTPRYVAGLLVKLEKPGFVTELVKIDFPIGVWRHEFAMTAVDDAEPAAPSAEVQAAFARGATALERRDWNAVRAAFTEVVELDPTRPEAWTNRAIAEMQLEEHENALRSARAALVIDPTLEVANMIVVDALTRLERFDEARAHRQEVAAADPKATARVTYNEAAVLLNDGKLAESMPLLRQALSQDPELADAHFALGLCLYRLGEHEPARSHLQRFGELAPGHSLAARAQALLAKLGEGDSGR